MRTYRIFGMLLVMGSQEELDKVDRLAAGTHHIRGNPGSRKHKHVAETVVHEEPTGEGKDEIL